MIYGDAWSEENLGGVSYLFGLLMVGRWVGGRKGMFNMRLWSLREISKSSNEERGGFRGYSSKRAGKDPYGILLIEDIMGLRRAGRTDNHSEFILAETGQVWWIEKWLEEGRGLQPARAGK